MKDQLKITCCFEFQTQDKTIYRVDMKENNRINITDIRDPEKVLYHVSPYTSSRSQYEHFVMICAVARAMLEIIITEPFKLVTAIFYFETPEALFMLEMRESKVLIKKEGKIIAIAVPPARLTFEEFADSEIAARILYRYVKMSNVNSCN